MNQNRVVNRVQNDFQDIIKHFVRVTSVWILVGLDEDSVVGNVVLTDEFLVSVSVRFINKRAVLLLAATDRVVSCTNTYIIVLSLSFFKAGKCLG